jgi:hypothetical protein
MRTPRLTAIGAVVTAAALVLGLLALSAPAASAAAISEGTLTWGVKQSWRNYAGFPIVSDEVTQIPSGEFTFPVQSGDFDPATGTTTVQFSGSVQWQTHWLPDEPAQPPIPPGYTGSTDIFLLDVTLTDPQVVISASESVLTVEAVSRSLDTWELIDYGRVPLVTLAIDGVTPTVAAGEVSWSSLTAAFTDVAASEVFGGFYTPGLIVDPVSFTYTGDGGAPLTGETFAVPGAPALEFAANGLVSDEQLRNMDIWWIDEADGIVHTRRTTTGPSTAVHQAFDLTTLQPIGQPLVLTGSSAVRLGPSNYSFVDPATDTAYYRSTNSGATVDAAMRWDAATQQYAQETLAAPFTLTTGTPQSVSTRLLWDATNQRAIGVKRVDPSTNLDESQWFLVTYTRQPDGSFVEGQVPLPAGPAGWNAGWYRQIGRGGAAIAADGSVILPRSVRHSIHGADPAPADPPGGILVQRIRLDGDTGTVDELLGTDLEAQTGGQPLEQVLTTPDGHVALVKTNPTGVAEAAIAELRLDGDALVPVAAPLVMPGATYGAFAIDPVDGTVWGQSAPSRSVAAFRGGVKLSEQSFALLHPDQTALVVGADRDVYALSNDGAAPDIGILYKYGFARLDWLGTAPVISTQPVSVTVAAGSSPTFTVAGTADPAPTIRWQARTPGSAAFADVDGATGPTLSITAAPEDNGTEYRAVLTNPAGAVASDVATLQVTSAPDIVLPPTPATAAVGETATFQVVASGFPEPTITWQCDVDGTWTDVVPSGSVVVEDATLRLLDLVAEQDGQQYRAVASNNVGTVVSDPVTLTVTEGDPDPEPGDGEQEIVVEVPDLGPGEFAWQIVGTDPTVDLGEAIDGGDHWRANGSLVPITVADTRSSGLAWSLSGQLGSFTGGISGKHLGWTPEVLVAGAGATAGPSVAPGLLTGDGLSVSSLLASAPSGHGLGTATVGADVELHLPRDTAAGAYSATLTITALS